MEVLYRQSFYTKTSLKRKHNIETYQNEVRLNTSKKVFLKQKLLLVFGGTCLSLYSPAFCDLTDMLSFFVMIKFHTHTTFKM
jgi:hypothetical protein